MTCPQLVYGHDETNLGSCQRSFNGHCDGGPLHRIRPLSASLTEATTPVSTASQKQLDEIAALNKEVEELYQAGKYAEAIPFAKISIELSRKC